MQATHLRHLAIIVPRTLAIADDAAAAVTAASRTAATMAIEAFAAEPGLLAFSFVAPGIDRLLDEPASAAVTLRGCVQAAAILEESAERCGATLRLCGRMEGLPDALARRAVSPPAATVSGRTLLWFLRYSGRDEVARAAARFFRARPQATLADEAMDLWLDTSGVPDPDLIVLVGGGFAAPDALVWQGSYAELWHSPAPWSTFSSADLRRAISDYHSRHRRFGG